MKQCSVRWLGRIAYADAWQLQKELAAQRARDLIGDTLLLLEHEHTYTFGSRGKREHLLVPREVLEAQGVAILDVDRGGDITYHGPGQLVGYPILRLAGYDLDAVRYLRTLENMLIDVARSYDLDAQHVRHLTGVWVGDHKIAAIGTKVDVHGITQHGFAFNVATDLAYFDQIVPCGIRNRQVGSLAQLLDHHVPMDDVVDRTVAAFGATFNAEMLAIDLPQKHRNTEELLDLHASVPLW
jgi:lipoyl(octanoyl) transferase